MVKNKKLLVLFCLSLIAKDIPMLASTPRPEEITRRYQIACKPVGRLETNGDFNFRAGNLLCEQDKIEILNGGFVKFFCYSLGKTLNLFGGTVSELCGKPRAMSACDTNHRRLCPKPKGGISDSDSPTIIAPYSSLILQSRPDIAWHPVKGATSYIVRLSGEGVEWKVNTNQTRIPYPKDQPELQFGNAYELTVLANIATEDKDLPSSTKILNRLTQGEVQNLEDEISKFKTILNLPADELSLDLSDTFVSQNLLTEAVEVLEKRAKDNSKDSTVYRQLGDLYLQAGNRDLAEKNYKIALSLSNGSLIVQKSNLRQLKP